MRKISLLAMLFVLSACGSKLNGEYADKTGTVSYTFGSGDKVLMSAIGIETEHWLTPFLNSFSVKDHRDKTVTTDGLATQASG